MAGWNLKSGVITQYALTNDRIWALFNHVFSDASRKRNTYKFGFIKALLDNVCGGEIKENGIFYSYDELFERFTYNYWNLVVKYNIHQMRRDGKSEYSKIELILKAEVDESIVLANLEYDSIDSDKRIKIIRSVANECKKYVIGALYDDFDGVIYSFDINGDGIILNPCIYEFMLKYKFELERLNYYAWARFLEKINEDNVLVRVIDKLELATPKREDLSIYREILRKEFGEDICFYCGRKLSNKVQVDHFIPWTFVKDDKIWNFVLSCPTCNRKKSSKLPVEKYLLKIEKRNRHVQCIQNSIVQIDFENYSEDLLNRIWEYAKLSGLKEFCVNLKN
ncbi:MAG: HNH endonuclease [Clostridium sp.]|nr:HNH endonuclease [Clostridium sp.]